MINGISATIKPTVAGLYEIYNCSEGKYYFARWDKFWYKIKKDRDAALRATGKSEALYDSSVNYFYKLVSEPARIAVSNEVKQQTPSEVFIPFLSAHQPPLISGVYEVRTKLCGTKRREYSYYNVDQKRWHFIVRDPAHAPMTGFRSEVMHTAEYRPEWRPWNSKDMTLTINDKPLEWLSMSGTVPLDGVYKVKKKNELYEGWLCRVKDGKWMHGGDGYPQETPLAGAITLIGRDKFEYIAKHVPLKK